MNVLHRDDLGNIIAAEYECGCIYSNDTLDPCPKHDPDGRARSERVAALASSIPEIFWAEAPGSGKHHAMMAASFGTNYPVALCGRSLRFPDGSVRTSSASVVDEFKCARCRRLASGRTQA